MAVKVIGEVRLPPEHAMSVNGVFDRTSQRHQVLAAIPRDRLLSVTEALQLAGGVKIWEPYNPSSLTTKRLKGYRGQVTLEDGTIITIEIEKFSNGIRMRKEGGEDPNDYRVTAFTHNGFITEDQQNGGAQVRTFLNGLEEQHVRAEDKLREELNAQPDRSWEKDIALVKAFLARKE